MPWCYTDNDCNRDYCDVCNTGIMLLHSPCPSYSKDCRKISGYSASV
jgi:hypothetical protein